MWFKLSVLLGAVMCLVLCQQTTADTIIKEDGVTVPTPGNVGGIVWLCESVPAGGTPGPTCTMSDAVNFTARSTARLFSEAETGGGETDPSDGSLAAFMVIHPPVATDKFFLENADPLIYTPSVATDPGYEPNAVGAQPKYDICSDIGTGGAAGTQCPCCVATTPEPTGAVLLGAGLGVLLFGSLINSLRARAKCYPRRVETIAHQ